jgi:tRNA-binding EMAP/Myf-like protein
MSSHAPKKPSKKDIDFENSFAELASLNTEQMSAGNNQSKAKGGGGLSAGPISMPDGRGKAAPEEKAAPDKEGEKRLQVAAPSVPEDVCITTADLKKVIQKIGFTFKKVIVVKVVSVSPHPKARKGEVMSVVTVNDGRSDVVVVCCNVGVQPGQLVPLAPVGSELADNSTLMSIDVTSQKLRGIESFGILCRCDPLHITLSQLHGSSESLYTAKPT